MCQAQGPWGQAQASAQLGLSAQGQPGARGPSSGQDDTGGSEAGGGGAEGLGVQGTSFLLRTWTWGFSSDFFPQGP